MSISDRRALRPSARLVFAPLSVGAGAAVVLAFRASVLLGVVGLLAAVALVAGMYLADSQLKP
jgi:hypothetical protein